MTKLAFTLREWNLGDVETLALNANNIKIWNNVRDYFPHPYSQADAHYWISQYDSKRELRRAICVNNLAVGAIGLFLKDDVGRKNAEIGFWLGEQYWGKGIVSASIAQITEIGFKEHDLHRIYAQVFTYNEPSKKALLKAGFLHEATLKDACYKNDKYWDEEIFYVLNPQHLT